jgi:phosphoketolase
MLTVNKVSRYDVALAAIDGAKGVNQEVASIAEKLVKDLENRIGDHASYIEEHGKGECLWPAQSSTLRELTGTSDPDRLFAVPDFS